MGAAGVYQLFTGVQRAARRSATNWSSIAAMTPHIRRVRGGSAARRGRPSLADRSQPATANRQHEHSRRLRLPGAETGYGVPGRVRHPRTLVVVNCAGVPADQSAPSPAQTPACRTPVMGSATPGHDGAGNGQGSNWPRPRGGAAAALGGGFCGEPRRWRQSRRALSARQPVDDAGVARSPPRPSSARCIVRFNAARRRIRERHSSGDALGSGGRW